MSTPIRFAVLGLIVAFAGCAFVSVAPPVTGSGIAKSEVRSISGVTKIRLRNVGTLVLKQSDRESLTVKGDDNIVPLMESSVVDGTLSLGIGRGGTFNCKTPMEYIAEVKSLESLTITGAGTAKVTGIDGKSLTVSMTGACKATIDGKVDTLTIHGTGACHANTADLSSKAVTVSLTGAGTANVHAEELLNVTLTGACTVEYSGQPKVTQSLTGASKVKKR